MIRNYIPKCNHISFCEDPSITFRVVSEPESSKSLKSHWKRLSTFEKFRILFLYSESRIQIFAPKSVLWPDPGQNANFWWVVGGGRRGGVYIVSQISGVQGTENVFDLAESRTSNRK